MGQTPKTNSFQPIPLILNDMILAIRVVKKVQILIIFEIVLLQSLKSCTGAWLRPSSIFHNFCFI